MLVYIQKKINMGTLETMLGHSQGDAHDLVPEGFEPPTEPTLLQPRT